LTYDRQPKVEPADIAAIHRQLFALHEAATTEPDSEYQLST